MGRLTKGESINVEKNPDMSALNVPFAHTFELMLVVEIQPSPFSFTKFMVGLDCRYERK